MVYMMIQKITNHLLWKSINQVIYHSIVKISSLIVLIANKMWEKIVTKGGRLVIFFYLNKLKK